MERAEEHEYVFPHPHTALSFGISFDFRLILFFVDASSRLSQLLISYFSS
jgi:hypothetical protein